MYRVAALNDAPLTAGASPLSPRIIALSQAHKGDHGVVVGVGSRAHAPQAPGLNDHGVSDAELEHRLVEIGFVEGAHIEVLHEGPFGRDPLAVRVDDMRIALRRREAADVLIELDGEVRAAS